MSLQNLEIVLEYFSDVYFFSLSIDKFDNIRFPPLILLKSFPQDVPEIVAPLYHTVDFRRMRSMVERCNENGVLNQEQTQEWWEFLEREETKEKTVQEAEVTVYSRDNGNMQTNEARCV